MTERLLLRPTLPADAAAMAAFYERNEEHLREMTPLRPPGYHDIEAWRERLVGFEHERCDGRALRLALWSRHDSSHIIGNANFSNVIRGAFQACYLGYDLDANYQGRGLMHEALVAALTYVFEELGLHRVMANYRPENQRSGRLLRRLGFVEEGYARDYLFISGAWRDHVLTARSNPNAPQPW